MPLFRAEIGSLKVKKCTFPFYFSDLVLLDHEESTYLDFDFIKILEMASSLKILNNDIDLPSHSLSRVNCKHYRKCSNNFATDCICPSDSFYKHT